MAACARVEPAVVMENRRRSETDFVCTVLPQRDSHRKAADWRGVAGPWRSKVPHPGLRCWQTPAWRVTAEGTGRLYPPSLPTASSLVAQETEVLERVHRRFSKV